METKLKVTVLSNTQDFEQNIVRGAKLCYSSADIETLKEKVTKEEAEKFLNMILGVGHGSVLEHSTITFGIEGVSRSLSHQLVRHRMASYSQKSQRYVKEGQFEYIIPKPIQDNVDAEYVFIKHMENTQKVYDEIVESLLEELIDGHLEKNPEHIMIQRMEENKLYEITEFCDLFKEVDKQTYSKFEKQAIENARYVLPNACETKIQATMNVRALFNFFKERLCERSQEEIRELAYQMWLACMEVSPTIFKHAVPTCVHGKCKEGKMSCGKVLEYKEKYKSKIEEFTKEN